MSETGDLRAAVVGLGKLGLLHAATLNVLPGTRLVAVADKTKTVLNALSARMDAVETFTDHKKLLDRVTPDIVAIATPTGHHVSVAIDCIERGIPVFIEKPLSIDGPQARPLLDALERNPTVTMVGYMTRFLDTFAKAKSVIQTGVLGDLQMLRASMYIGQLFGKGKGWRYDRKVAGGGVLTTQNSHVIDLLLWYFGDIDWVSAHANKLYSKEIEDHAHLYFGFRNGLRGYLDASWSARHYRTPTVAIHIQGSNGTIDVSDDDVRLFAVDHAGGFDAGWHTWRKPDLYKGTDFDIGGSNYTEQAKEFLAAVRGQGDVSSDVASAYKVQCVIDAAYASAETNGQPVTISEGA